jgi:hypothetical protein
MKLHRLDYEKKSLKSRFLILLKLSLFIDFLYLKRLRLYIKAFTLLLAMATITSASVTFGKKNCFPRLVFTTN